MTVIHTPAEQEKVITQKTRTQGLENDYDNNNSIQFNSMIYYLCAESTAIKPITDTAQCTLK
jgi:hypothetical protein